MRTEQIYDVVVLGSGIAGLASAVAAQKLGLRTLVLEAADRLGGGTCHSTGIIWVGCNHLAADAGLQDDPAEVAAYLRFLGGGQEDPAQLAAFIASAPGALRFFEDCGVRFQPIQGMADHYYGAAPHTRRTGRVLQTTLVSASVLGPWQDRLVLPAGPCCLTVEEMIGGRTKGFDPDFIAGRQAASLRGLGIGVVTHFLHAALQLGVDIRCGQRAQALHQAGDGCVDGVVLPGGELVHARRGVVLATGGYESNPDMVRRFEGLPNWKSYFPASLQGDGMALGGGVGGAVGVVQNNMQLFLGFAMPQPGEDMDSAPFRPAGIIELCSPHTMVVNRAGRRFANESVFQLVAGRLRDFDVERHRYANLPCFLLFDRRYTAQYSFGGLPVGTIPPWVSQADTLDALAQKLGVDAPALAATVARFNGFARQGVDEDFGRAGDLRFAGKPSLGTLEEGPFYGVELRPAGSSSAGLLTDTDARVLAHGGARIGGLYAVGNAAAKTELGVGYQAGLTIASGMTFGLRAARALAAPGQA